MRISNKCSPEQMSDLPVRPKRRRITGLVWSMGCNLLYHLPNVFHFELKIIKTSGITNAKTENNLITFTEYARHENDI